MEPGHQRLDFHLWAVWLKSGPNVALLLPCSGGVLFFSLAPVNLAVLGSFFFGWSFFKHSLVHYVKLKWNEHWSFQLHFGVLLDCLRTFWVFVIFFWNWPFSMGAYGKLFTGLGCTCMCTCTICSRYRRMTTLFKLNGETSALCDGA